MQTLPNHLHTHTHIFEYMFIYIYDVYYVCRTSLCAGLQYTHVRYVYTYAYALQGRGKEIHRVAPEAGTALLHQHGSACLLHAGLEVLAGEKWILRSDVIFG